MKLIFFLILSLVFISCNSPTDPPPVEDPGVLIPLKVGNYWIYQDYLLNDDGTIRSADPDQAGFIIPDSTVLTVNGKITTAYNYSIYGIGGVIVKDSRLIYNGEGGVYYCGLIIKDTLRLKFNDLLYKYPTKKGESVEAHIFYYNPTGDYMNIPDSLVTTTECVSTDSLFSTPKGDFRCIVYKTKLTLDGYFYLGDTYSFYKPNLGLVGLIDVAFSYVDNQHHYFKKSVLVDYKIN